MKKLIECPGCHTTIQVDFAKSPPRLPGHSYTFKQVVFDPERQANVATWGSRECAFSNQIVKEESGTMDFEDPTSLLFPN